MKAFASIEDLHVEARRRVPKPFYEYMQNGAFTQTTMDANGNDLNAVKLRQHMLGDKPTPSLSTTMLGWKVTLPVGLAPVGLCGMNRARGEILAARAARDYGVPFCLSTFSIVSIEDLATDVGGSFWFQLYPMEDMKIN